jgi:hypothetical protein
MSGPVTDFRRAALAAQIERVVAATPVVDVHTHLYDPCFGNLLLWGIDELLTYHYLVAESFRHIPLPYDQFWSLSKTEQAELIWQELFLEHSPVSEACRGVLTTLHRLGLDVEKRDLAALRGWFAQWPAGTFLTRCLEVAHVKAVYMSNSPFDDQEHAVWLEDPLRDERFRAALRIDPLLVQWPVAASPLAPWG